MSKDIEIVTFGCRLNTYESEVMKEHAQKAKLKDTIIVNTCAVTAEAERQARQAIRKLRKENPNHKIIVTGCAAQVHAEEFGKMEEVDTVIGNDEKMHGETYEKISNPFIGHNQKVKVNDIMEVKEISPHLVSSFDGHTRAFIQVQNGCDHRCTFCIIPYGRGNSRSVGIGEIVNQVKKLVEQGYKEVVLTGVDISSYGGDLPGTPTLGQMVKRLLGMVPELPRLRISSIDCIEIDEDLFNVLATEERLMPHMHLSLQSGDTMILKRMARRHNREDIISLINRLRDVRPDITFGADIIAGFPTETEEMFENTLDIIKQCNITWVHAFPYSEREGTPAARIPNKVPMNIRKERAKKLRELSARLQNDLYQSQVGKKCSILVEKNNRGYTEHYIPVKLEQTVQEGTLVDVVITGFEKNELKGSILMEEAI
ncbi:MAG: tRNA (N(6)-L-threonylcarbamoyladenosine(37)-C(2))-methylthiotransferase MtaB [Alphaproteobacteria bacterium]